MERLRSEYDQFVFFQIIRYKIKRRYYYIVIIIIERLANIAWHEEGFGEMQFPCFGICFCVSPAEVNLLMIKHTFRDKQASTQFSSRWGWIHFVLHSVVDTTTNIAVMCL